MADLSKFSTAVNLPPEASKQVTAFLGTLDELLEDPNYLFAADTLSGIRDSVSRTQVITEGQRGAVRNIERSVVEKLHDRDDHAPRSRRYEGFNR